MMHYRAELVFTENVNSSFKAMEVHIFEYRTKYFKITGQSKGVSQNT